MLAFRAFKTLKMVPMLTFVGVAWSRRARVEDGSIRLARIAVGFP
jgi:hypothetical protein